MDEAILILLAVAANPPRHAGTVTSAPSAMNAGGKGAPRRWAAAAGWGGATGVVVTVIAAADAILAALDLTRPTTLLAVALVAIVTGLHDAVTTPAVVASDRAPLAATTLAIVVLLRPAVVVAALGAGAGGAGAGGALLVPMAVAGGALGATTWAATSARWRSPVSVGLGRLVGAALVVVGVDLGVDAALAV